jgi:UDP-glucose:(heptosyl)LPS alpha-1,3-glucosyltransferase
MRFRVIASPVRLAVKLPADLTQGPEWRAWADAMRPAPAGRIARLPMKIALIILNADTSRGGAERYTVELADAMARRGHSITLLSGVRRLKRLSVTDGGGWSKVGIPMNGLTRSAKYECFSRGVESWLAGHPQDLTHAMLPMRQCDIYHPHAGLAVDALRGKPVQTLLNPRRRLFARIERDLLTGPHPPVVLCLSDMVRREFLQTYPAYAPDRLKLLFNAVDLERFQPPPARATPPPAEALLVAQSFKLKGVATAIRALAEAPGVTLTVVGRDHPGPYLALAGKLGVAGRVRFEGAQTDVRPFYQRATFLVLPTRRDSCSLVVLEALACGLPVISTRFNGACEIMRDGTHGRILDEADDAAALAAAMRRLCDPATVAHMQAACVALRPELSQESHLDTLAGIYQDAAARRPH